MSKRIFWLSLVALALVCLSAVAIYNYPPVHERIAWRIEGARTSLLRRINPPEQQVFIPQEDAAVQFTAPTIAVVETSIPTAAPATPTGAPPPTPTPQPTFTPIPSQVNLTGVAHEYQKFNNCGPATLAMALSYWGWQGDQGDTRKALRPNFSTVDDKNVNPWEMAAYSNQQPGIQALSRTGGDLETLKRLVAAGFPVIIEAGIQHQPGDWMGHYLLISGYDDAKERLITQDSLVGADIPAGFEQVTEGWHAFNNVYIVLYPAVRSTEVLEILGANADPVKNLKKTREKALDQTAQLSGRDLYFAWFNLGSTLVALADYPAAARAYDRAFGEYANILEDDRPWRMLWYQDGPYQAYYHSGRYQDLIRLGNQVLDASGGALLEETYYWLGRAREATGDLDKASYDYQKAYAINPNTTPARAELERLGIPLP